jgi:outer membrane protein OmpA-like peptidoglycan-associated protein
MKCNPWRWLWGLVPVLVLGWAAVQIEHVRIERDLAGRAKEALTRAGLAWADVLASGRDVIVSGKAIEEGEPHRALQTALETWGVREVNDDTGLIDMVERYEWTALRRDNRIRLNGLVPNERTRRDVIGIVKASFPNLEIDDRLRLARGAPPLDTWLGGVGFGIKQLAQLKSGQIDLDTTNISVAGEALDVRAYQTVKTALRSALPPGISLRADRVTAPVVKPYTWSLRRTQDQAAFAGYVPNDKLRDDMLAAVRGAAADIKMADETQPADGAPEDWANAVLAAARTVAMLEDGTVEIRDAVLTLSGTAETEAKAEAARNELRQGVAPAFKVTAHIGAREPVATQIDPYVTTAVLEGNALAISGYVPSESAQQALNEFAKQRLPAATIRNEAQIGTGQPAGWLKCIEVGLDALARLGAGRASLTGRRLEISGSTQAGELAGTLADRIRASVGDACETDARIALQPEEKPAPKSEPKLRWSAAHDGDDIILSGEVAGPEARADLLARAQTLFPRARLVDKMTVTPEASEQWTGTAREGLALLAQLRRGQADLVEQELTITGEADKPEAQEAIRKVLADKLPKAYRGQDTTFVRAAPAARIDHTTSSIETKPAPETAQRNTEANACQELLRSVAKKGVIEFDRGTAELESESIPTLEQLAEVASKCPAVRFEVAGHADADGTPRNNQRLSERRAQSVVDFLIKSGVAEERMQAVGYGTTQPLAPNTTPENKAKNRRIEFFVRTE